MVITVKTFGYSPRTTYNRRFVCYFHHTGFNDISIGASVNFRKPNLEIHVPFGFFRIGWDCIIDVVNL